MPKKLSKNARLAFWSRIKADHFADEETRLNIENQQRRFLLVNNLYLATIFGKPNIGIHIRKFNTSLIQLFKSSNNWFVIFKPLDSILIQLAKLECIQIFITTGMGNEPTNEVAFKKYVQFCLGLKQNRYLKRIYLRMDQMKNVPSRIFLDALFNKIYAIKVVHKDGIFLDSRFELEKLIVKDFNSDFSNLMQVKARQIELKNHNDILAEFSKCGRFKPNPWIEKLQISVDFGFLSQRNFHLYEWKDYILPQYENAVECLKSVNPELKLQLYNPTGKAKFYDSDECIIYTKQFIENIKLFIGMAQGKGIKVDSIEVDTYVEIHQQDRNYVSQLADSLQLKCVEDKIQDTIWYNHVEIKFKMLVYSKPRSFFIFGNSPNSPDSDGLEELHDYYMSLL